MDVVSLALNQEVPLAIEILSDLGKGLLRKAISSLSSAESSTHILELWHKLFLTAISPRVNDKHITAACNALCVYLSEAAGSSVPGLQQLVQSRETWSEAFQCVHKAFNDGKTKPAFQILEILCDMLHKQESSVLATHIVDEACSPLLEVILLGSLRSDIKKASLLLSCFLRRNVLSQHLDHLMLRCISKNNFAWKQRLSRNCITLVEVSALEEGEVAHLLIALVFAMVDLDTRSAAVKLFSSLSDYSSGVPTTKSEVVAKEVVGLFLERNHAAMGSLAENILPVILTDKEKLMSFVQLYASSCQSNSSQMVLFLAIMKIAKSKAMLSESEVFDTVNTACPSSVDVKSSSNRLYWIEHLLRTAEPEVQILSYGLLVSSPAGNAVLPADILDCIASNLKYVHNYAEAHERGEILSISRRLLRRAQHSAVAVSKSPKSADSDQISHAMLQTYGVFMQKLVNFLRDELGTGVSYPRHILSLLTLQLVLDFRLPEETSLIDTRLVTALLGLVLDPFEDVRETAMNLLLSISSDHADLLVCALTSGFLERFQAMSLHTGRADHADALGRISTIRNSCFPLLESRAQPSVDSLLEEVTHLEQLTSKSASIKLQPGSSVAVHGCLLSISYQLRLLHIPEERPALPLAFALVRTCENIWLQVREQLCVDSPETATEFEDTSHGGPKDLLAYSWRALRDSSIALQSLIVVSEPSEKLFLAIGQLCMDQLITLRHRGAFSTVAQTFGHCSEKIRCSGDATVSGLIGEWYTDALGQIEEQSDRLTRRSAGLPAMLTALLSSNQSEAFSTAITDLVAIAEQPTKEKPADDAENVKLPQVHALNCLKEITTNSKFSIVVAQYLEPLLELAATCLSSKTWAVRNCGLMLLRACINRLDQSAAIATTTSDNAVSVRPRSTPVNIVFRLLDDDAAAGLAEPPLQRHETPTEHVFAGLDLLAYIFLDDAITRHATRLVMRYLSHPTWAVRDRAALLLATRMLPRSETYVAIFLELLGEKLRVDMQNEVHGRLLCCRYVLETTRDNITRTELHNMLTALDQYMTRGQQGLSRHSPYVYAAHADLVNEAGSIFIQQGLAYTFGGLTSVRTLMNMLEGSAMPISRHQSYLRPRIMLLATADVFLQYRHSPIPPATIANLCDRFLQDPDSIDYVLLVMEQRHIHYISKPLTTLLISVVRGALDKVAFPPSVLERSFTFLAACLEVEPEMSVGDVQSLLDNMKLSRLQTPRDLGVAAVQLYAALLSKLQATSDNSKNTSSQMDEWLQLVKHYAGDEVDFPTRIGGTRAITILITRSNEAAMAQQSASVRMQLLMLLYDFMNDDDEEIRHEATKAACKLGSHRVQSFNQLGYCALGAREKIVAELQHQLTDPPALAEAALSKILDIGSAIGSRPRRISLKTQLRKTAMTRLIDIAGTKNDLFAEEKQNLYIDDLQEIQVWTEVLHHNAFANLPSDLFEMVNLWTSESVQQIIELLELGCTNAKTFPIPVPTTSEAALASGVTNYQVFPESLFGHPLGISHDHEILVVLVQVISIAGLLCQHDGTKAGKTLPDHLDRIKTLCSSPGVNSVLQGAVNRALCR